MSAPPAMTLETRPAAAGPGAEASADLAGTRATKLKGLVVRRECWILSGRGWLAVLLAAAAGAAAFLFGIFPFLAPTQKVDTDILVVEGWVHRYAIEEAAREFRSGKYSGVYSTGTPVIGLGGYVNDFQTAASVGADNLLKTGLPRERVHSVPSRVSGRDRTYSSAVALREALKQRGIAVKGLNIVTEDVHGRRTRLLFEKAFGKDVRVGIISIQNPDYQPSRWWRYSQGVRDVLGEIIAYGYARVFFWPNASEGLPPPPSAPAARS